MSSRKRNVARSIAASKRTAKNKAVVLRRWQIQEQRLLRNIAALEANETMQPPAWVEGQKRYFQKLLANHRSIKPRG